MTDSILSCLLLGFTWGSGFIYGYLFKESELKMGKAIESLVNW